jgi:hypothetical protein
MVFNTGVLLVSKSVMYVLEGENYVIFGTIATIEVTTTGAAMVTFYNYNYFTGESVFVRDSDYVCQLDDGVIITPVLID